MKQTVASLVNISHLLLNGLNTHTQKKKTRPKSRQYKRRCTWKKNWLKTGVYPSCCLKFHLLDFSLTSCVWVLVKCCQNNLCHTCQCVSKFRDEITLRRKKALLLNNLLTIVKTRIMTDGKFYAKCFSHFQVNSAKIIWFESESNSKVGHKMYLTLVLENGM